MNEWMIDLSETRETIIVLKKKKKKENRTDRDEILFVIDKHVRSTQKSH